MQSTLVRLLAGNIIAQAVTFGCIPLLTRIYPAEAIADWGVVLVVVNMVWAFSQLRTDIAMFQAHSTDERNDLYQLGMVSHALISMAILPLLWVSGWVMMQESRHWIWLVLILLSHGFLQMSVVWLAAGSAFDQQNKTRLWSAVIAYPGAVLLGWLLGGAWLLPMLLLGSVVPLLLLTASGNIPLLPFRWQPLVWKQLLSQHRSTGFYLTAGNLLAAISDQALVLLIAHQFSAVEAAACFLAMRVCGAPLSMVQAALSPYNYRHFQDLFDQKKFHSRVVIRHWLLWLIPALLFFLPLMGFGPQIFSFILGKDWNFAGSIASILALWAGVKFLNSPTSMGFFVMGKPNLFFLTSVLMAATVLIAAILSWSGWTLSPVLKFFSLSQIIVLVGCNALMLHHIDRKFNA